MYHYRKLKCLLLLMLVATAARAQLEDGNVYNFVNIENAGKSMTTRTSGNNLTIATTDESDYSQLWYADEVETGVYTLRNLGNGKYLRSPNANGNANWTCVKEVEDNAKFIWSEVDDNDVLRASNTDNSYHYLHYGSGTGTIVCWSTTAASQWTFTEVSVGDDDLAANWAKLLVIDPDTATVATYQEALDNLFSDKSCTTPKKELTDEDAIKADADYQALPEGLQKMVLKVYLDDWAEDNYDETKEGWDASYAEKYRVQMYEPYNEPGCASTALSLNAHTNLNNPTGIFANTDEALYVMVEGTIEEGASLYLASLTGHNRLGSYTEGVELHEGLNVIPSFADGNNYYINYVVETFDTSDGKRGHEAKARPLTGFPSLKIHIEGGYINGYWNKVGDALYLGDDGEQGDTNADWDYIEARATQTDVIVLGKYMTLQFPFSDDDTEGNKGMSYYLNDKVNVEDVINSWDNVMMWERLLLGVLDQTTVKAEAKKSPYSEEPYVIELCDISEGGYGDYYNVHGLAFGVGGTAYMYGAGDHSGYHYNTMEGIIQNMPTSAGSHWGPAHEIGHQHQNLLKMRGEMEVSNNLFSNVVLWYYGETTSRVNGTEGSLEKVLENFNSEDGHYLTNNIWAMTHMYYKLFLYYHVLGHNPQFYPRLFELLRHDPSNGMAGTVDGDEAQLHLYRKVCEAAGEDLTEFFRAYGFFKPLDSFVKGDYGESTFYMTQEQIDEAIAEVKALKYEENLSVLFINDATGEEILSHKGDVLELYGETAICAEVGSYASFTEDVTADYTYSVSGNTVTMEGNGGVGFAIYNAKGELIAFSDKKTFEISDECAELIVSGEAEFKVVNADNMVSDPVDVMDTDDSEAKYTALGKLLETVESIVNYTDDDGVKVGYYRTTSVTDLKSAYTAAKTVYDAKTVSSYTAVYDVLYQEYVDCQSDDYARIGIVEGNAYQLVNKLYPSYSMSINSDMAMIGETTSADSDAQRWYFEPSDTDGRYYLKNKSTSTYPGNVSTSVQLSADKTESTKGEDGGAYAYELRDMGSGLWALVGNTNTGLHCDAYKNIVGWTASADATQWYITAVEVDDITEARYELEDLITKTEALMAEVGEVTESGSQNVTLTEDSYYCNAECKETTYGEQFTSYSVLCDEDVSTYLHTDYSGNDSDDGLAHYIRIDVGESNTVQKFKINYTTRQNTYPMSPTSITIAGSNDLTTWHTIEDAYTEGLPKGSGVAITLPTMGNGVKYRYIRFMVNRNANNNEGAGPEGNKHIYFALSELGISKVTYAESLNTAYSSIASGVLLEAFEANSAAQGVLATATTSAEYETAYEALETKYNALLEARKAIDNAALTAKKAELNTLITNTTDLIASCGTVTYTAGSALTLSTTSGNDVNYLSGGPSAPSEGSIANLLDNDVTTSYVSNWNAQSESPYLQVTLPDGQELSKFTFTFTSRNSGNAPTPTTIVVSGSNDGDDFTEIDTFTKDADGFPEAANDGSDKAVKWTSPEIVATTAYKYLRFTVTTSERSSGNLTDANGYYHFGISEFGLGTVGEYVVDLGIDVGDATEELVLAAYLQNAEAQSTYTMATTISQVEKAIAKLQADYDALNDAKNSVQNYTVSVVGGNGNGGVTYNTTDYTHGQEFSGALSLTVDDLTAIALDGYTEGVITMDGTTITVTYQKIYTVQVTGGGGNGGVTFGEQDYADDATFDAEQASFTAEDLTAIVPDGYTLKEVTVDHETGVISVSYAAIPLVDTTKYYTLACKATDHDTYIRDLGTSINGRSAEGSLFQFEAADEDNGYYIKSYVSEKYLNCTANDNTENDAVVESEEKLTVWKMAEPSHTDGVVTLTAGYDKYLNNNGDAPTYLLARYHSGGPGSSNACSLWTLTEGEPLDMSDLATLIEETNTLIESCYTDEEFNYSGSLNVTEDLMTATNEAVTAAQEKYDSKATTASEYEAVLAALQTAKDNLQTAINYAELPVQITFDANTPVTYKIAINRSSGAYILEYDNSTTMVAVTSKVLLGAKAQAWYFMAATDGKVYIMPYHDNNTTLALSTNDFSQGNSKVKAMEVGADGYTQAWTITANADNSGWYNITCTSDGTDTWYFSNHGGVGNKMGFYNDANDAGTLFKFEQVTIDKSEAYYALYNYYTNDVKLATGSIVGSEEVGYISTTLAEAYNTAYNNAATVLVSETATDDDYTSAYDALVAANDALVVNMPEEGKCYRLRSVARGTEESPEYAYVNSGDNKMYHSASRGADDATTIWSFTETGNGTYKLANLHTGTYMADNGWTLYQPLPLYGEAEDVEIVSLSGDGQVGIWCGDIMLHADGNGKVVRWEDGAGSGSAWHIVEVEDMSLVNFSLIVSQYLHAGLYLNYPVTIPDGVKAYIIDGTGIEIDADGVGTLKLTKMEGEVLPAGNGYILDAPAGDYDFYYTEDEATDDVSGNMLGGSPYLTYRAAEADHNYYVFGRKGDVVGLYKNAVKYDASGTEVEDVTTATHYKVSANKVLFDWNNTSTQVSSFRFRVEDEATDIENVGVAEDMLIYDLCGRRIMEVKTSGLYIINGEKRYVEVK